MTSSEYALHEPSHTVALRSLIDCAENLGDPSGDVFEHPPFHFLLFVHCDGSITWRANKLKGKLYLAGSKLPADRAAQNNDPNYQASDGYGCDCVVDDF